MNTKPFWQSKTVILNVLGLLVVIAEYLGTINIVNPELTASVLAILNLILRTNADQSKDLTLR